MTKSCGCHQKWKCGDIIRGQRLDAVMDAVCNSRYLWDHSGMYAKDEEKERQNREIERIGGVILRMRKIHRAFAMYLVAGVLEASMLRQRLVFQYVLQFD